MELVATGEGKKTKLKFGTVWRSQFPGVYNITLAAPHPTEVNDAGYSVDDDIVAVKTRSGAKYKVERKLGFFINLNAYDAMEAKPPYEGGGNNSAPAAEEESFDDGDF